jgi:hypothetical protein
MLRDPRGAPSYRALASVIQARQRGVSYWAGPIIECQFFSRATSISLFRIAESLLADFFYKNSYLK